MQFSLVGWLVRVYIDALVRGNPFAVFLTAVLAVAISVGPFYQGLRVGDPVAITMVCVFGGFILIALSIVIYDKRKQGAEKRKRAERARAFSPSSTRVRPR